MTLPSLPAPGNTSWYAWASAVHTRTNAALTPDDIDPTPITAADFGLVAPKGVRVNSTAAQTVANAAYPVYLDLNATEYNEDSTLYTVDLTANKIIVSAAGLYLANWGAGFVRAFGADIQVDTYLTKNGGNALVAAPGTQGPDGIAQANGMMPLRLAANDYVQVICYVVGAAATLSNAAYRNYLALSRIGL